LRLATVWITRDVGLSPLWTDGNATSSARDIRQEKKSIPNDASAQRTAELVAAEAVLVSCDLQPLSCIELVVAEKLEKRAVDYRRFVRSSCRTCKGL
jgi:hypothetical protein